MFRKTRSMVAAELAWIESVIDEASESGWDAFRVPGAVTEAVRGDEQ